MNVFVKKGLTLAGSALPMDNICYKTNIEDKIQLSQNSKT